MKTATHKRPICLPTLKILSDYWTLRIIDELSGGKALRFTELERQLDDVNTATLSKRLKNMCHQGLSKRQEISRADVVYSLTELGEEVVPILAAINRFSELASRQHS